MNLYKNIESEVKAIATRLELAPAEILERIEATPTRDIKHGEVATNAAMVIAAPAKRNPREIAAALLPEIEKLEQVEKAEIAGPGFINMTLTADSWRALIPHILEVGKGYGNSEMGAGQKVNVEYVSANPTGPMHVGHGRGAVVGDALSTLLLKAGYNVTKEYYINDAGGQIDKLAETAYLRYREALGEDIGEIPEGLYPGDYMIAVGKGLAATHGKDLLEMEREQWLPIVRRFSVDANMAMIKEDLAMLGVYHDIFTSEQSLVEAGAVEETLKTLEDKNLIYTGVLEPPKGKQPDDWEPTPQTLFKSTQYGDDLDRAIKKSDGSWTYFAPDMAYHYDKYKRGFNWMINIFGADHGGYVSRISAAVRALSEGRAKVDVKLCQMVKFLKDGEPLKMSKRAGTFVTVREVVDEVGKDVFRFIMLTRKSDQMLDFDFTKVMEQSKDNPVFYVQYAHARICSVMRLAGEEMPDAVPQALSVTLDQLKTITSEADKALLRKVAEWPRLVEAAASAGEPHRIAYYLQELAAEFHGLWNLGTKQNELRFLQKDAIEETVARLSLAKAIATVIASGLMVLGVEPVEEMR